MPSPSPLIESPSRTGGVGVGTSSRTGGVGVGTIMLKEPWKTIVQIVITILTALTTTVSANATGLTHALVAML